MRLSNLLSGIAALAILAAPAFAQVSGSLTGTAAPGGGDADAPVAGLGSGAMRAPHVGHPAPPLGGTASLSDRIDNAAGLNSNRSIIAGMAGSLGPEANRATGNTTPGTSALERAGRPAGAPLGTGAISATPAPPGTVPGTPTEPDPRRTPR